MTTSTLTRRLSHLFSALLIFNSVLLVLYTLRSAPSANAQTTWWDTNWLKRQRIVVNNPTVTSDTSPWSNFIILVVLSPSRFDYNSAQPTLSDLRFVWNDDQTILPHEIEAVDRSGNSFIWVRLPAIVPYVPSGSSGVPPQTTFWMYYNNSAATTMQYPGMWADYRVVYHAQGTADREQMKDSSPNAYNLDNNNSGSTSYSTGVVGKCVLLGKTQFSRSGSNLAGIKSAAFWQFDNDCTTDNTWERVTTLGTVIETFSQRKCSSTPYRVKLNGNPWDLSSISYATGQWLYIVVQLTPSGGAEFYINGVLEAQKTGVTVGSGSAIQIGSNSFDGALDEFRAGLGYRIPEWWAYEYRVQQDAGVVNWTNPLICDLTSPTARVASPVKSVTAGETIIVTITDVQACSSVNIFTADYTSSAGSASFTSQITRSTTNSSVYTFPLTLFAAGSYTGSIKLNGTHITNSPYTLKVNPDAPLGSVVYGPGLNNSQIGGTATFNVVTKDIYGNFRTGDNVTVTFTRAGSAQQLNWATTIATVNGNASNYLVTFTPMQNGYFKVYVAVNGISLNSQGWDLTVSCNQTSSQYSFLKLDVPPSGLLAGVYYTGTISVRTTTDQPQTCSDPSTFTCKVTPSTGLNCNTYLNYQVQLIPLQIGNYTITVLYTNSSGGLEPISVTPATVTVIPGPPDPTKTIITDVTNVGTDEPGFFLVWLYDINNNPVNTTGQNLTYKVNPPGYSWSISIDSLGDKFRVNYRTTIPGNYFMNIAINNMTVPELIYLTIGASCNQTSHYTSLYETFPSGDLVAGGFITVNITAKDSQGNDQPCPDQKSFIVSLMHIDSQEVVTVPMIYAVAQNFMARTIITRSGQYQVIVKLDSNQLQPPRFITVDPAETEPENCNASGPGLKGGVADVPTSFNVQCKDKYNNFAKSGGNTISMKVYGRQELSVADSLSVMDHNNGSYTATYVPPLDGTLGIEVYVDNIKLPNSFLARFSCNPTSSEYSFVQGSNMTIEAVAGYLFNIYTKNSNNNNQTCTTGDKFRIEAVGMLPGNNITIDSMSDRANFQKNLDSAHPNEYSFYLDLIIADNYTVSVLLGQDQSNDNGTKSTVYTPIQNSGFSVSVIPGETSAAQSTLDNVPNILVVKSSGSATVTARDKYRNRRTKGGDTITVETSPSVQLSGLRYNYTDSGDGRYEIEFSFLNTGIFTFIVKINDNAIPGSPSIAVLQQPQDCNSTSVSMSQFTPPSLGPDGLSEIWMVAGQSFNLSISTRDAYGNRITCANWAKWEIKIFAVGNETDVDFRADTPVFNLMAQQSAAPSRDVYTVSVAITTAGNYTALVYLDGNYEDEAAYYDIIVVPAPTYPSGSIVYGEGSISGVADVETTLLVQARDIYRNNRTQSGDTAALRLIAVRPILEVNQFRYLGDGLYAIDYTSPLDGSLGLRVFLNDQEVGSGYLVTFECNPTSFEHSWVDSLLEITATPKHTMHIYTKNTNNHNQTCSTIDTFTITVNDTDRFKLDTTITSDGEDVKVDSQQGSNHYTFSASATQAGWYLVSVNLRSRNISNTSRIEAGEVGSFVVHVLPGATDPKSTVVSGPGANNKGINVNEETWFTISLYDQFGNSVGRGGDNITVVAVFADNASGNDRHTAARRKDTFAAITTTTIQSQPVPLNAAEAAFDGSGTPAEEEVLDFGIQIEDQNNGTYLVRYTPSPVAGNKDVILRITVNGEVVGDQSPSINAYMYVKPPTPPGTIAGITLALIGFIGAVIIASIIIGIVVVRAYFARMRAIEEAKPPNFVPLVYTLEYQIPKDSPPRQDKLNSLERLLLADESCEIIGALMTSLDKKEVDDVCKALVAIFEANNYAVELIMAFIMHEVSTQLSSGTLFRANSPATKLMSCYTMMVGLPYLYETLGPLVREAMDSASNFELDDRKMQAGDDANLNRYVLMATTQKMIVAITKSADRVPRQMREIASFLRERCMTKFDDTKYTSVGGYFILRFVTPALVSPEMYGLTKRKVSDQHKRLFILISKTLQNLANGVEFGQFKEAFMAQLNELITENKQKMYDFFDAIAQLPPYDNTPVVPMPRDYKQRCLAQILALIEDNAEDLENALQSKTTSLQRLKRFLAEEEEDQEMQEYLNTYVYTSCNISSSSSTAALLTSRSNATADGSSTAQKLI